MKNPNKSLIDFLKENKLKIEIKSYYEHKQEWKTILAKFIVDKILRVKISINLNIINDEVLLESKCECGHREGKPCKIKKIYG